MHGDVYSPSGEKVRHLYGTWNEAMFCGETSDDAQCVWKAGENNVQQWFMCVCVVLSSSSTGSKVQALSAWQVYRSIVHLMVIDRVDSVLCQYTKFSFKKNSIMTVNSYM